MKKKLISILVVFCIVFSSCSRQEGINTVVFSERFSALIDDFDSYSENAFFDDEGYHCLFVSSFENFMLNLYRNESDVVYEATVVSESKEISDRMKNVCIKLIETFVDDEPAENIIETLVQAEKGKPTYLDTQWFAYSMFISENGFYFSVYDKLLQEYPVPELTLKGNDLAGYK